MSNRERRVQEFEDKLWSAMAKRDASADRALSVLCSAVYDGDRAFLETESFELVCERLGFGSDRGMALVRYLAERCIGND